MDTTNDKSQNVEIIARSIDVIEKKKKQFRRVCVCVPNGLVNNIGCPLAPSEGQILHIIILFCKY